ncbi:hypothetical protein PPSIR1_30741 [Plesiocystis pacifica SIR-1]|uniref:Styrene monooxygenase StyA putative substrate binding domain-containing protein n=2 Tax=Plesiocystis pacifica TaxID=191768 RepID=A6GAG1_9BACT|nr:hypothetical protein PPSIR1_30741 [Plesiocystis pacifica SIR-1]
MVDMRKIAIIGAGQAGLQLGFGLLRAGYSVTLCSDKSARELEQAGPRPVTIQFGPSVLLEQALDLCLWRVNPLARVDEVYMSVFAPDGQRLMRIEAELSEPAQSMDLRLKFGRWLRLFADQGGEVAIGRCGVDELERLAQSHDLVVVSAGRGQFTELFAPDPSRCEFDQPQRQVAMFYTRGCDMRVGLDGVEGRQVSRYSIVAGVGEVIMSPFLSRSGEEHHYVQFEAIPDQGMDMFDRKADVGEQYDQAKAWLAQHQAEIHALVERSSLTPEREWVCGRIQPKVREPVGALPSGAVVMGIGDAVIVNDPVMAQGLNSASKWAAHAVQSIQARGDAAFSEAWMRESFEAYWARAQFSNKLTNTVLCPLGPVQQQLLGFASQNPRFAKMFVEGIGQAEVFDPWFWDEDAAKAMMARYA